MKILLLGQLAIWLVLWPLPASAGALTKVDRTIAKEPAYQTKEPKYCLVVFGSDARTRVWLVLDGDTLYVDRNGNGDLTEAGEAVKAKSEQFESVPISAKEGVASDTSLEVQLAGGLTFVYCHTKGKPWQRAVVDKAGNLQFGGTRQAAPVIHFNGPLTLAPRFDQPFDRVPSTTDLEVMVGTSGLGVGTFARLANDEVVKDQHPVAEIAFPTADGTPEKLHIVLDQRC